MRFIFKTNYAQDINMARHSGDRFWYGCLILLMLAMPLLIDDFYLGEIYAQKPGTISEETFREWSIRPSDAEEFKEGNPVEFKTLNLEKMFKLSL